MGSLIQNSYTSLLPVYSSEIPPGGVAVVLLSTTTNVGQLITVRDMDGFLSSPQQIKVSTTPGVSLNGGSAAAVLKQGFGYLTLRATGAAAWTTVDTSAFADPAADYDVRGVSYSSFQVTDQVLLTGGLLTTGPISSIQAAFNTIQVGGQMSASTLGVSSISSGTTTNFQGPVAVSTLFAAAPLTIGGTLTTGGTVALSTNVSSLLNATMNGTATFSSLTVVGEVGSSNALAVAQTMSTGGLATFGSARTTRSLTVSTATTQLAAATNLIVSSLALSTAGGSIRPRSDIPITDPAYSGPTNPVVFTDMATAAPTILAAGLAATNAVAQAVIISNLISTGGAANILFSTANIQNPNGGITVSSASIGSASLSNTVVSPGGAPLPRVGTGATTANGLISQYEILAGTVAAPIGYLTLLNASSMTVSTLNTGLVELKGDSLTISTVFVSSAVSSPQLSSFLCPVAAFVNTNGQTTTSSFSAASATVGSLSGVQLISSGSTLAVSAPALSFSTAFASSATASTATTSSMSGVYITLGQPLNYSTIGPTDPWISTSTVSGLSSNTPYEYIQGLGTPYQPLRIRASNDRTVNLYLRNVSTFSTTFFTANMSYRNDSSISGVAGLRIVNAGGTSTIISFNANPVVGFQKQVLSNYPIDLNVAPSTTTYWLAGPNTIAAPSTIIGLPQILAGGSGPSTLAVSLTGDTASWTGIPLPPFTTATNAAKWNSIYWVAGGSGTNTLAYSANGSNWVGLGTTTFTTSANAVAWNGSLWVAAGAGTNTLAYSYNGFTWIGLGTSIFGTAGNGVAWDGTKWVAAGAGTNCLAYSYDGLNWVGNGVSTFANQAYAVAFGGDHWVAVGGTGSTQIACSTDGITWLSTINASTFVNQSSYGYTVAWSGSQWVAGGDSNIQYSSDGFTWTRVGVSTIMSTVRAATWLGSKWLIGGTFTTHALATSPNAATWTGITASTLFTTANVVANQALDLSANDLLVGGSTGFSTLNYSMTGYTWSNTLNTVFTYVNAVAYGFRQWVAVGKGGTNTIAYSADGATWTGAGNSIFSEGRGIAWNGYMWVAVGDSTTDPIAYSYNGSNWTGVTTTTLATSFRAVAWDYTQWYVFGTGTNTVATSADGLTWTGLGSVTAPSECVAWNGSNLWVGGAASTVNGNTLLTSANGTTWTGQGATTFTRIVKSVAWNGSLWTAVGGANTTIATSPDGSNWTARTADLSGGSAVVWTGKTWLAGAQLSNARSAPGLFLVAGAFGSTRLGYSTDGGVTWTASASGTSLITYICYGVAYNGSRWVAVGENTASPVPAIIYSDDGINWTNSANGSSIVNPAGTSGQVLAIVWNGTRWVAGANIGGVAGTVHRILYSSDGNTWTGSVSGSAAIDQQVIAISWNGTIFVATGATSGGAFSIAYSSDGITWTGSVGPSGFGFGRAVAWNGSLWLIGGRTTATRATIIYSYDAIQWWEAPSARDVFGPVSNPTVRTITWNGSKFIAGAEGTVNRLIYSTDGFQWFSSINGNTFMSQFAFGSTWTGTQFVAAGWGTPLALSVDGITWKATGNAGSVFNNQTFCVATQIPANTYPPNMARSDTGITWSTFAADAFVSSPTFANAAPLPFGAADSNIMLAGSSNATTKLAITTDGKEWNALAGVSAAVNTVSWNGRFWMLGLGASPALQILTNTYTASTPTQTSFNLTTTKGIAWGLDQGLAVGQGSSANHIAYTTDGGLSWSANRNNLTPYFFFDTVANGIGFGSNLWVAVGQDSTLTQSRGIRYSANGINWSTPSTTAGRGILLGCAVAYHSSIWVAGGSTIAGTNDTLAVSADGATWNYLSNTTFSVAARGIAWGSNKFVAVGEGTNTLAYSANGSNWTGIGTSIFSTRGHSVAWNGKYFVAVGEGTNTLAYSADGISWTGLGTTTFNAMATGGIASRTPLPIQEPGPSGSSTQTPPKTFTWSLTAMTELSQTSVQKPAGGSAAWNARAASAEAFTASAWLSFQPAQTTAEIMFGLSENPTATLSFTALNFAFYMTSSASLRIYELGTQVAVIGSYSATDTLRITYDGATVRYYQNSTLVRSVARSVGAALYMSSSFFTPGGTIQSIDFHPLYTLTTSKPALSTTGYAVSQTAGTSVDQFGPFYLTLTSNLLPSLWNFYVTLNGMATSTNSLYADVFINETKYFSTTVVNPVYSTLSTYLLSFSNTTAVTISTPALLDVRFRATRGAGDTNLYTNWVDSSGIQQRSSATVQSSYNPNGIEYLQFFHTSFNSGLQTSELDIYVSRTSTLSTTYLDSNAGVDMYFGYLKWNTGLNATTIENRYNDTQTRSLTYSGSLYNASDPRLKEDIVLTDGEQYLDAIRDLPLHRYRFLQSYRETYRQEDTNQLGVLTTELHSVLPHAVLQGPADFQTVDRAQLRFAHMAATQALIARVSTLRQRLLAISTSSVGTA